MGFDVGIYCPIGYVKAKIKSPKRVILFLWFYCRIAVLVAQKCVI